MNKVLRPSTPWRTDRTDRTLFAFTGLLYIHVGWTGQVACKDIMNLDRNLDLSVSVLCLGPRPSPLARRLHVSGSVHRVRLYCLAGRRSSGVQSCHCLAGRRSSGVQSCHSQ